MDRRATILRLLAKWADASERYWYNLPGAPLPGMGAYGSGYNNWGVQTNQKYLAALAVLATHDPNAPGAARALERALGALRFSLWAHVSGPGQCTDGSKWGCTWISGLGIERMMHGVRRLEPHLTDADRAALRRMLTTEADWLATRYAKSGHTGVVVGDLWNHSGRNEPESNLWNGAILYRTAAMYPDHPQAGAWLEKAHEFLLNGVSVPADAEDETIVAGRRIRDWFRGANFFPHYALDHHGYMNVGYMVICLSNAAILHFDLRQAGLPACPSVHHHQRELWQALRPMIFTNGRLARLGGDTRARYCYCQDYLLPALLYAQDELDDASAATLLDAQLQWIDQEADTREGSLIGRRLEHLTQRSPYYYTRLESDRAVSLGMVLAYEEQPPRQPQMEGGRANAPSGASQPMELPEVVTWMEPEHGDLLHRCPTRLASFSWRAYQLAQGLCLSPDDGHLAEWDSNLVSVIEFLDHPHPLNARTRTHRRLLSHWMDSFPGGFVTVGSVMEGCNLELAEGWAGTDSAVHHIALAALPDGHTVVGLELCRLGPARRYVRAILGMHLNVPNDLFNHNLRRITTASGTLELRRPLPTVQSEDIDLTGRWACVDDRLGVVGVYGASNLSLRRAVPRLGGPLESLYVEKLCWGKLTRTTAFDPGATLLDCGWVTLASTDATATAACADSVRPLTNLPEDVRGLRVTGRDGKTYVVLANFGAQTQRLTADNIGVIELSPGRAVVRGGGRASNGH